MPSQALAATAEMREELPTLKNQRFYDNTAMLTHSCDGEALAALLMKCPALEKLDLESPGTTPKAFAAFAEGCGELRAQKLLDFQRNRALLATRDADQPLGSLLTKCTRNFRQGLSRTAVDSNAQRAAKNSAKCAPMMRRKHWGSGRTQLGYQKKALGQIGLDSRIACFALAMGEQTFTGHATVR